MLDLIKALESSPHLLVQEQVTFNYGNKRVDISLRAYGITHDIQSLFRVAAPRIWLLAAAGLGFLGSFLLAPMKGTVENETEAIGWRQVTMNQQNPAALLEQVNGSLLLPPVAPKQDEEEDDTTGTDDMDKPGAFTLGGGYYRFVGIVQKQRTTICPDRDGDSRSPAISDRRQLGDDGRMVGLGDSHLVVEGLEGRRRVELYPLQEEPGSDEVPEGSTGFNIHTIWPA